jgi:hypothetical protein
MITKPVGDKKSLIERHASSERLGRLARGRPAKFDYNDSFSESQAGSASENSDYYPVGQINQLDSTCWIAYGFNPSGKELGGCYQLVPTPVPTKKAPTPVPCPGTCNTGTSKKCCTCPGWYWTSSGCRLKPPA